MTNLSRYAVTRRVVLGGLAVSSLKAYGGTPGVPQVLARVVRNGWGICGRPGIDASVEAYGRMLSQIGTRDIRLYAGLYGATAVDHFRALGQAMQAAGMDRSLPQVTMLITAYLSDSTTWAQQQTQVLTFAKSGMLRAIEGPNEMNNRMGNGSHGPYDTMNETDYASNYLAWAKELDKFSKENRSELKAVSIVAPCIASGRKEDYARLPDVSDFVDAGNMHFYAGHGYQPSFSMGHNLAVGYFDNIRLWAKTSQASKKTHLDDGMWCHHL